MTTSNKTTTDLDTLFKAGVHFGRARSRRHPSAKAFIFGVKNTVEIFDLETTKNLLDEAMEVARALGEKNQTLLMVGGKSEARAAVRDAASSAGLPFVAGRFIGGTLTNWSEIKKRIARLESLTDQKEKGELVKYTKKERLLIDREIETLREMFGGIASLKGLPNMLFVVDPRREHIAVAEANNLNIPVMALAGSDCDMKKLNFPIPGNDALESSIRHITERIANAYKEGRKYAKESAGEPKAA